MAYLDFCMLYSGKNSWPTAFIHPWEKLGDFSYLSGNWGRTPLGITTCQYDQEWIRCVTAVWYLKLSGGSCFVKNWGLLSLDLKMCLWKCFLSMLCCLFQLDRLQKRKVSDSNIIHFFFPHISYSSTDSCFQGWNWITGQSNTNACGHHLPVWVLVVLSTSTNSLVSDRATWNEVNCESNFSSTLTIIVQNCVTHM